MIVTQFRTHLICVLTGLSWIGRQVPEIERYVDGTFLLNHNPKIRILSKKFQSKMGCLLFGLWAFERSHTIIVT